LKVGTPSVVSRADRVAPEAAIRACLVDRECHAAACTVLTPGRAPAACVSTPCGAPLGQRRAAGSPCGFPCAKARDASDRLLPSHVFVRAPAPRGFPARSRTRARALPGGLPGSRQGNSLRRAAPVGFSGHRGGRCLPLAMCADAPLTPLSRLPCGPLRLRARCHGGSRRDRHPRPA